MLSNKPYLLRAFYQWIIDSGCTPILVIDPHHARTRVPQNYVEGDEIVFNISAAAISDLKMMNEFVEFKASFSGVVHLIFAPIQAILAVYAEENGEGVFFDPEEEQENLMLATPLQEIEGSAFSPLDPTITPVDSSEKKRSFLKLVE